MIKTDKVAYIRLPENKHYINLHGYWHPPECVLSFCATHCVVKYINDKQYEIDKIKILESYKKIIKTLDI